MIKVKRSTNNKSFKILFKTSSIKLIVTQILATIIIPANLKGLTLDLKNSKPLFRILKTYFKAIPTKGIIREIS